MLNLFVCISICVYKLYSDRCIYFVSQLKLYLSRFVIIGEKLKTAKQARWHKTANKISLTKTDENMMRNWCKSHSDDNHNKGDNDDKIRYWTMSNSCSNRSIICQNVFVLMMTDSFYITSQVAASNLIFWKRTKNSQLTCKIWHISYIWSYGNTQLSNDEDRWKSMTRCYVSGLGSLRGAS